MKFRGRVAKRGFTLLELLVVISIISVLMAILMPALQRVREQGRRIVCSSHLRDIYFAYKTYQLETDRYLPHTDKHSPHPATIPYTPWFYNPGFRSGLGLAPVPDERKIWRQGQVLEWMANTPKRYICPSASWALKNGEDGLYSMARSYGVNIVGDYEMLGERPSQWKDKETWVRQPATKLFFIDAMDWWVAYSKAHRYLEFGENWYGSRNYAATTYGSVAFRHNDGSNVLFWDGHVGYVKDGVILNNESMWDPLR